ncbi:MAG: hypothetical protein MZW92_62555 [Comamonadaceae bacterium]|nr:hypothetical protein [Comamonadaceae bacterium]
MPRDGGDGPGHRRRPHPFVLTFAAGVAPQPGRPRRRRRPVPRRRPRALPRQARRPRPGGARAARGAADRLSAADGLGRPPRGGMRGCAGSAAAARLTGCTSRAGALDVLRVCAGILCRWRRLDPPARGPSR